MESAVLGPLRVAEGGAVIEIRWLSWDVSVPKARLLPVPAVAVVGLVTTRWWRQADVV